MDNRGWGLGTMLGLLAILLLGLLYSFALINQNFGLQDLSQVGVNDYYKQQEEKLVDSATNYSNTLSLENGNSVIVTIKTLKAFNYIEPVYSYNKESECSGYIKISRNNNNNDYEPYLKCPQYTTKNYNQQDDK